jgi:ribosome-binding protein aMBF1 (putative translation factor)
MESGFVKMEVCGRCGVEGIVIRLFDAIYDGKMESICERCSIIENIPIIKKPDNEQLKESERGVKVFDRMKRLSGMDEEKEEESYFKEDRLEELNKHPELELPEREKLKLIEYFHWQIMKNRRSKGLTQEKLAEAIGESLITIQMLEKEKYPENSERVIRKLEQYFQIPLTKITEMERIMKDRERESKMLLLNSKGEELLKIPEPEPNIIDDMDELVGMDRPSKDGYITFDANTKFSRQEEENKLIDNKRVTENESNKIKKKELESMDKPEIDLNNKGEFDIKSVDLDSVTVDNLKDLHKKKVEVSRRERLEEQKKIEERERLIEARKEELRMRREKESDDLDSVLGGAELLEDTKNEFDREL